MTIGVESYEKLGASTSGRPVRPASAARPRRTPLLYDSRDLLTHALCVGMTGSGKTGLCIVAARGGGDRPHPGAGHRPQGGPRRTCCSPSPSCGRPTSRPGSTRTRRRAQGITPGGARREARPRPGATGSRSWGQGGERIARLREAAEFADLHPGQRGRAAGLDPRRRSARRRPRSLADGDLLRDRVATLVVEPPRPPRHRRRPGARAASTSCSPTIFDARLARRGRALDLAGLIQQIQKPPVERIGVLDLESFYPGQGALRAGDGVQQPARLARLRAPGSTGEPLDVDRLLYTAAGKPRVAIFSIAHLSDRERMFFVSLLLDQTLGWMRTPRRAPRSLRALLYMDEVFGYLPPVAEPPSKRPLLTLLKQARAFGLGRRARHPEPGRPRLQGARQHRHLVPRPPADRARQAAAAGRARGRRGAAAGFDRAGLEQLLSGLAQPRLPAPRRARGRRRCVFETRWAMSYLRGPLTRPEIKRLMDPRKQAAPGGVRPAAGAAAPGDRRRAGTGGPAASRRRRPAAAPVLPPDVPQRFLPVRGRPDGVVYEPALFAAATSTTWTPSAASTTPRRSPARAAAGATGVDWYAAEAVDLGPEDLEAEPVAGAALRAAAGRGGAGRSYDGWRKELEECLYRTRRCELFRSARRSASCRGRARASATSASAWRELARERRDAQVETLRAEVRPSGRRSSRSASAAPSRRGSKQAEQARQPDAGRP